MRLKGRLTARFGGTFAASVLTFGCLVGTAAPARASPTEPFDYQVTPGADPYRDIPGTEVTFTAVAGERSYLWSRNVVVSNVTSLREEDVVGTTLSIRCSYAGGTPETAPLPAKVEAGAYWAANFLPTKETAQSPTVRWAFVAPEQGTYSCRLSVTSYSSIVASGREVTMRVDPGAELARATYPYTARWTLPEENQRVVESGTTATTLGYTIAPTGADRIAVVQDTALTTCKAGSKICPGGTTAYDGTSVQTWIEAQPQRPDGTRCGSPKVSTTATWRISDAKHHQASANTLYLATADLGGCPRVRVSLKVRNTWGNPVVIHAGHVTGHIARTHGLAFTY
ncbi:hypothetical protein [Streptomyces lavendofoliae]|uniref:Ig-like domain-containing protein n=1 Tax=Streptomyces lavendofoliae TaxID=67314 RepID=A0A918HZV3_9ACTN|nr:hypothetical protein [Streptomyces lavendofoliae]GGU50126.1 hypothetical protein GCM10010274_43510 [Streptomyces lavendofoliae]